MAKSFYLITSRSFCFLKTLRGSNCYIYSESSVQTGDESVEASGDNYLARIKSRTDL